MRNVLQLFRKDVHHLWPWIAVTWVLLALFPIQETMAVGGPRAFRGVLLQAAVPLAMFLLVIVAIQQEKLIGDRQYWLTRPFTVWHLMAAKLLFFVVFLNVPILLVRAVMLRNAAMPVAENLLALVCYQLLFTLAFILPVAALGAVSKSVGQTILALVATYIVFATVGALRFRVGGYPDWGAFHWIRALMTVCVIAIGGAFALVLQYRHRKTLWCRLLLATTAASAFAMYSIPPIGLAVAVQTALTPERADRIVVRFDETRVGQHALTWRSGSTDRTGIQVKIPVRIDGLAPDLEPVNDWTRVCVTGTDGGTSCSEWDVRNGNTDLSRQAAWLRAFVDRNVFNRLKDTPVRVHGTVAFTLLRRAGSVPISSLNFETAVPGAGRCGNRFSPLVFPRNRQHIKHLTASTVCDSPRPRAGLAADDNGTFVVGDLGPVYSPVPLAPWITPWVRMSGAPLDWLVDRAQPTDWIVVKPVVHLRREFDFSGIRLTDYASTP